MGQTVLRRAPYEQGRAGQGGRRVGRGGRQEPVSEGWPGAERDLPRSAPSEAKPVAQQQGLQRGFRLVPQGRGTSLSAGDADQGGEGDSSGRRGRTAGSLPLRRFGP